VVLNREDRQMLNVELFDEVTGLGPLETAAQGRHGQRYSGQRPEPIFVERSGKLELTDVRFKDEKHLLRIIDKIVSPWAGASTNPTPTSTPASRTARVSTPWSRPRHRRASSRSGSSRRTSWASTTW
jgi:hypothetical protein